VTLVGWEIRASVSRARSWRVFSGGARPWGRFRGIMDSLAADEAADVPSTPLTPVSLVAAALRVRAAATAVGSAVASPPSPASVVAMLRGLPACVAPPHAADLLAPLPVPAAAVRLHPHSSTAPGLTLTPALFHHTRPPGWDDPMRSTAALADSSASTRGATRTPLGYHDRGGRVDVAAHDAWCAALSDGALAAVAGAQALATLLSGASGATLTPLQRAAALACLCATLYCAVAHSLYSRWGVPPPDTSAHHFPAAMPDTARLSPAHTLAASWHKLIPALTAAVRAAAVAMHLPALDDGGSLMAVHPWAPDWTNDVVRLWHAYPWVAAWMVHRCRADMVGDGWKAELHADDAAADAAEAQWAASGGGGLTPSDASYDRVLVHTQDVGRVIPIPVVWAPGGGDRGLAGPRPPRIVARHVAAWLVAAMPPALCNVAEVDASGTNPIAWLPLLSLAFRLSDDWETSTAWMGGSALASALAAAPSLFLRLHADVLSEVVRRWGSHKHPVIAHMAASAALQLLVRVHGPPPAVRPASLLVPTFAGAYDALLRERLHDLSLCLDVRAQTTALVAVADAVVAAGGHAGTHLMTLLETAASVTLDSSSALATIAAMHLAAAALRSCSDAFVATVRDDAELAALRGGGEPPTAPSAVVDAAPTPAQLVAIRGTAVQDALDYVLATAVAARAHADAGLLATPLDSALFQSECSGAIGGDRRRGVELSKPVTMSHGDWSAAVHAAATALLRLAQDVGSGVEAGTAAVSLAAGAAGTEANLAVPFVDAGGHLRRQAAAVAEAVHRAAGS